MFLLNYELFYLTDLLAVLVSAGCNTYVHSYPGVMSGVREPVPGKALVLFFY